MTNKETIIDDLIKARVNKIVEDIVIDKVNEIVTSDLSFYIKKATLDFWTKLEPNTPNNHAKKDMLFEAVKELSEMRFSPLKTVIERIAENCINEKYKSFSFDLKIQKKEI